MASAVAAELAEAEFVMESSSAEKSNLSPVRNPSRSRLSQGRRRLYPLLRC